MKEARTQIKLLVKRKIRWGYEPGSMLMYCGRRTSHFIRGDISFIDLDGDMVCGTGTAYLRGAFNYTHVRGSRRGCESF